LEERKSGTSDEAETLSRAAGIARPSLVRKQLLDADDVRAMGFAVADAIAAAPVLNCLLGVRTVQIKSHQLGLPGGWLPRVCFLSHSSPFLVADMLRHRLV
jgi:hypothetical protein